MEEKADKEEIPYNTKEETPIVFIEQIVNAETGKELPTDLFGEKILDIIGQTPKDDLEFLDNNLTIAHRKDLSIDIYYSVGFKTK